MGVRDFGGEGLAGNGRGGKDWEWRGKWVVGGMVRQVWREWGWRETGVMVRGDGRGHEWMYSIQRVFI